MLIPCFEVTNSETAGLFEALSKNKTLVQSGESPLPIVPGDEWRSNVYKPRIAYAKYSTEYTSDKSRTNPPIPYEVWKETEYKKILAAEKERMKHGN